MADVPTEDQEQTQFVAWLRAQGYPHFRVPNETYTKSFKQRAKNKRLGVVPGVPDVFVALPGQLLAIEMKRTKGSVTSQAQAEWVKTLNESGVHAYIAKGAEAAIAIVQREAA